MQTNETCGRCDFFKDCRLVLEVDGLEVKAKEQSVLNMKCLNVVADICRDCKWFYEKKCASWNVLNGEVKQGSLSNCPKKIQR